MGRGARDNPERFRPRPVQKIEIDDRHSRRKLITALILLAVGIALLVYSVMELVLPKAGWQVLEVNATGSPSISEDFTFICYTASSKETKAVSSLYTSACQKAFRMFQSDQSFEDVASIYDINTHPNEVLTVDEGLYEALSVFVESGRRELYLGPVYDRYEDLFFIQDASRMVDYDPRLSEDVRWEYDAILAFANDPQAVRLELLGDGQVRLAVSQEYLAWAEQEGVRKFIDFSWMRNAFAADYLAGELTAAGYTQGSLSSYDGFVRNLDGSGVDYTYSIYHRRERTLYPAAELHYREPMAFVRMRDYPLSEQDLQHYYVTPDGEIRTSYLDVSDALCRSAVDTLVCYSREAGCARILLEMIPVYIADSFQEEAAAAMTGKGIQSVYCQDSVVRYTDPEADLENFYNEDGVKYTAELVS